MKEKLIEYLNHNLNLNPNLNVNINNLNLNRLLQKPKLNSHGDLSLPIFIFAKELKKNPNEVSKEFERELNKNKPNFIKKIIAEGPFLNFYFNIGLELENLFKSIFNGEFFKIKNNESKKILIEYPSPNTNKSLHIGHVRNMLLGNSISNILEKNNYKVIRTNMNNDRGIAICKTMLSYKLFHKEFKEDLNNLKSDEFVSYFYVLFNKKNKEFPELKLEKKAQEMLVKWENNDEETIKLWKKLLKLVLDGYKITYNNYKVKKFDKEYFESEIYKNGRELILSALKKNIDGFVKESDGSIIYDFKDKTYGKKHLLRSDGTSLYITQDLYLAKLKEDDFHPDKSIFVVGKEQKYHFEVLFKILEKLNLGKISNNYHLAYGYVYDKNGKKFSSRLGNTIGADEILNIVIEKAKENLIRKNNNNNNKLSNKEIERRSNIIGFSALAFMFLKTNPNDDIKFDIEKAISFEGETGPYVLYTYARIKSIIRKSNFKINNYNSNNSDNYNYDNINNNNNNSENNLFNLNFDLLNDYENRLSKMLIEYPEIIVNSAKKYQISNIANYLIKLSKLFNEYYQKTNIIKTNNEEYKKIRLILIYSISEVIKDALKLYDIEVLEEM